MEAVAFFTWIKDKLYTLKSEDGIANLFDKPVN